MTNKEIFEALKKPFKPEEIQWRIQQKSKDGTKGMALAYMDSRAVMNRLDEVVGPENWRVEYKDVDMGTITRQTYKGEVVEAVKGFLATITVTLPDGTMVAKSDGSGCTATEPFKGALSGALKRAANAFGIGRYLYSLESQWVPIDKWGHILQAPRLPKWALPEGYEYGPEAQTQDFEMQDMSLQQAQPSRQRKPSGPKTDANGNVMFASGKYAGMAVKDVTDFGYLKWVAEKSSYNPTVKAAANQALQSQQENQESGYEQDVPF